MSGAFDDALASVDGMGLGEVDTSFIADYRRRREAGREQSVESEEIEIPDEALDESTDPQPDLDAEEDDLEVDGPDDDAPEFDGDDAEFDEQIDPEVEPEVDDEVHHAASRGGSAAASATAAQQPPVQQAPPAPEPVSEPDEQTDAVAESEAALAAQDEREQRQEETEIVQARRKSDHQDAVQAAVSRPRRTAGSSSVLPTRTGFSLPGSTSAPLVRNLPEELESALREQIRSAAVRERGASDIEAREFSRRLSQPALVTAFLMAQLDVRLEADSNTATAAELFRSQDPLLGTVVARMDRLEEIERERGEALTSLIERTRGIERTSRAVEQALAYSIADREENFLRGSHNVRDAPITHRSALLVRDRVREETKKQHERELDRDGRPMR